MKREALFPWAAGPALMIGLGAAIVAAWTLAAWPMLDTKGAVAHLIMPSSAAWTAANVAAVFAMWSVMMAAMMLPGAVPMVLFYGQLVGRNEPEATGRRTTLFVLAYLVTWAAFSAAATVLHWGMQSAVAVSPMGVLTSPWVAAALLVAAGLYQLTPLKEACLKRCRTPFGFLTTEWRAGDRGGVIMGLRHGSFCVGCCWALMVLAFVGGTMNLLWMVVLTVVVTVEKTVPRSDAFARLLGVLLVCGGAAMAASA